MATEAKTHKRGPDWVGLPLRDFPIELKRTLAGIAKEKGSNLNEVAVEILARRLKVPFVPRARPSPGLSESTYVSLEMPGMLRAKIKAKAALARSSARDFVIRELREEVGG